MTLIDFTDFPYLLLSPFTWRDAFQLTLVLSGCSCIGVFRQKVTATDAAFMGYRRRCHVPLPKVGLIHKACFYVRYSSPSGFSSGKPSAASSDRPKANNPRGAFYMLPGESIEYSRERPTLPLALITSIRPQVVLCLLVTPYLARGLYTSRAPQEDPVLRSFFNFETFSVDLLPADDELEKTMLEMAMYDTTASPEHMDKLTTTDSIDNMTITEILEIAKERLQELKYIKMMGVMKNPRSLVEATMEEDVLPVLFVVEEEDQEVEENFGVRMSYRWR